MTLLDKIHLRSLEKHCNFEHLKEVIDSLLDKGVLGQKLHDRLISNFNKAYTHCDASKLQVIIEELVKEGCINEEQYNQLITYFSDITDHCRIDRFNGLMYELFEKRVIDTGQYCKINQLLNEPEEERKVEFNLSRVDVCGLMNQVAWDETLSEKEKEDFMKELQDYYEYFESKCKKCKAY